MSEDILDESCQFSCSEAMTPVRITAQDKSHRVRKPGGRNILTTKAVVTMLPLPQCRRLTAMAGGNPAPCGFVSGRWQNAENGIKISGMSGSASVLTKRSYMPCQIVPGCAVKPQIFSSNLKHGAVPGGAVLSGGAFAGGRPSAGTAGEAASAGPSSHAQACSVSADSETAAPKALKDKDALQAVPQQEDKLTQPDPVQALYAVCNYAQCGKRDKCSYFRAKAEVSNDSQKLRTHFQSERKQEWEAYEKLHTEQNNLSTEGNWRIAAHHIISGNQVLLAESGDPEAPLRFGVLVKLCSYFGYDINGAENCIMLPTNEEGFGGKEGIMKVANAYTAMGMMGRQWHVGGHAYTLDRETLEQMRAYGENLSSGGPEFFKNYQAAMIRQLDQLLMKYSRPRCWKYAYERRKAEFFSDMNRISRQAEQRLLKFRQDPRSSFPLYVSRISVEYAFDLPRSVKLAVIYRGKDDTTWIRKLRAERFLKDGLRCILKDKGGMLLDGTRENALELVNFCENIFCFLIERGIKAEKKGESEYPLPFTSEALGGQSVREIAIAIPPDRRDRELVAFLQQSANELFAYGQERTHYHSPAQTAAARRKEIS